MQQLLRDLAVQIYSDEKSLVSRWRADRMRAMMRLVRLPDDARVVDLGGSEYNWRLFPHNLHVTLVNLPDWDQKVSDPARFAVVGADACDLRDIFADRSFDFAFSNSTIEHVGDARRQEAFAAEVRRLAPAYWVQTPSSRCPIEAHTGVPFYWSLPAGIRRGLMRRWERDLPGWAEMVKETRILNRRRMQELFPDGRLYRERRFGVEKSYSLYRACGATP
jgi:hypothetical protein